MTDKLTEKEVLKRFPGLQHALPTNNKNKKLNWDGANNMRREICDFARDHNFVIHPGRGYDYYVENFHMFNCCPCDKTRLKCPCDETIEEVPRVGHCLCRLFWRSLDDFKGKMLDSMPILMFGEGGK